MTKVHNCMVFAAVQVSEYLYDMRVLSPAIRATAKPGHFVRVLHPETLNWIPVSICNATGDIIRLIVDSRDPDIGWLTKLVMGDNVDMLGPFGDAFSLPKDTGLLIGSGEGVVPLFFASVVLDKPHALLGYRSAKDIILVNDFAEMCDLVQITTEDGSVGHPGGIVEALREKLSGATTFTKVFASCPGDTLELVAAVCAEMGVELNSRRCDI